MEPVHRHPFSKFTTEAIVAEGRELGALRKVCTKPTSQVTPAATTKTAVTTNGGKVEQEKQSRELAR
jgi:ParB family chromosome partitioning protein